MSFANHGGPRPGPAPRSVPRLPGNRARALSVCDGAAASAPGARPWLIRPAIRQLTPSAFQTEMSLSTKQRLARAKKLRLPPIVQPQEKRETSHDKFSAADPEQSSFQPCPPEVVFQNFSPGEVCEVPLILRNRDTVPHLLKVTLENSLYFQLVGPNRVYRKVPPGLYATVRILFTPGKKKDYFHQLLCSTEREEFIVPIWAIGARAILDFPDQLDFSVCPVNYTTEKTLLVLNVGDREAYYQLSTQGPFSVNPSKGVLDVDDFMQVTVEFQPKKSGDYSESLVVHYDTGEETHTSLHARAVDALIGLDRNTVTLEKTYITMSNRATVLIHNRSNITARFQWKALGTEEEEDQLKLRRHPWIFQDEKETLQEFLDECGVDITCRAHVSLLIHSFQKEVEKFREQPLLFNDDIFSLEPKEGEIRPNCSAEISVFFTPQAAGLYTRTAYCDISGRENRLPLVLTGEGLGPRLHLRFEEMDIGEVFIRVNHRYEAYLVNKGPVEASFKLIPPTTAMGSCFTFVPQEGTVAPHKLQAIQFSFCPTILGKFEEEFCFEVTESPEPLIFTVRGSVMGPTFHVDVPALNFGDISFGFPRTLKFCLFNTSLIPMAFSSCIPEDNFGELSVDSSTQICRPSHPTWRKKGPMKPEEFTISPCCGNIRALGSQDIKVTLCPNTVGDYNLELLLAVEDAGSKVLALPLTARCVVPPLRVLNPVVDFGRCCLTVLYDEKLTLVNDSDFPGCYCLLPQEHKEEAAVWYFSSAPSGIIEAHSSVEIPVTVEARLLGECSITAELAVFGRPGSPLEIRLECIGQGPAVYVHPREIKFGSIPVLEDCCKTLHLANQSVIPANFQLEMVGKSTCWRTEPSKGVVPPNSEVSVAVIANLNDTVKFQEKVKVFIENNPVTIISLQAVGIGTTVVTDKPLVPRLDLKSHFSLTPCFYHFTLTNRGRRPQRLYWSTEGSRTFRRSTRPPALGGPKSKDALQIPRPGSPVFKLRPPRVDLRPGQSVDMVLEGCSSTAQEVKERLLCHAVVGKETAKKQIMEVDVTCNFICPVVQMSSRAINFRVEKKPSDVLTLQYQPLSLKNTSSLPLSIVLDVEQPFRICNVHQRPLPADSKPVRVDVGKELHLWIQFNPAYKNNLNSWVAKKVLRVRFMEHPHVEKILVRGEVYFPNLHLQAEVVDFGCIINDTEQVLHMEMTNCSPLPVSYHWSLLTDRQVNTIRFLPSPPKFKPQSSKKKGVFPWRRYRTKSVEEPTETPETVQDPAQENSDEKDSALEDCTKEDSALEDPDQEDPDQEDPAQEDSDQEPADAEHSLETEVLSSTPGESQTPVRMRALSRLMEMERPKVGMQEVFGIRPLWGELQPGESEKVTFTFFGFANIVARVTALCHVEGGPTYKVVVTGQASCPSYQLDVEEIDWGLQVFNKVLKAEVTLRNTGVMEFPYVVPNSSTGTAAKPLPGVPVVVPSTGSIAPGEKQVLKVYYLPGELGVFHKTFQVQVAYLEPAEITLKGKGTFPRVTKYLPKVLEGNEKYEKTLKRLIKHRQIYSQGYKSVVQTNTESPKTKILKSQTPTTQTVKIQNPETQDPKPHIPHSGIVSDTQLQIKMMRMLIEKPFLELKVELLEYVLDMGPVLKGYTETHTLEITNPGQIHVSFQIDVSGLQNTGFSVDRDQMNGLPPSHTLAIDVCFESAHKPKGDVEVVLPIEVTEGPMYSIRLRATVLELSLDLSKKTLEFSDILIGQCQVETIRLYNQFRVPCKWFITSNKPVLKVNTVSVSQSTWRPHMIGFCAQKNQHQPCAFEVTPSQGTLDPGKWQNLQIQFTPKEERFYEHELELNIRGSSNRLKLHLSGQGLEPRLEFRPPALKMGWMLVDSDVVEATVVVKNPCKFPIEFYSLDFDEQYLEEEKILRMAVGSEYQKSFFMPPRAVGETLPPEVMEDHEAQRRPEAQQAELKAMAEAKARDEAEAKAASAYHRTVPFCPESMVKGTGNPVSRAVMRHLGIAPSSGRREAQQHQGIVVIIHGPPRAGKTEVAAGLCQYYDAAYVSIDTVVKEAMANDQSPAGLRARELCTQAAVELEGKEEDDAGVPPAQDVSLKSPVSHGEQPNELCNLTVGIGKKSQTKNKQASGEKIDKNVKDKTPPAQKKKETDSKLDKKDTKFTVSTAPAPQQLNIISSRGEKLNCLSCVLPEELLVDILSERLKVKDCSKGVIFDGLESLFASSLESSLLCVLRAIKNRHHIFMVNLHQDYASWKARDEAERKRKEAESEKEALQRKAERLWQIDEEEYDALPKEKKAEVDKIILERKHIWRKKKLKQLAQKVEEEAKALEEEERRKEKRGETKAPEKKETKILEKETKPSEEKETKAPEKEETKILEIKRTKIPEKWKYKAPKMCKIIIPEKEERKAPKKGKTKPPKKGGTIIQEDPTEMENLILRFQIYESSQQNVAQVFSYWDRVQGTLQLPGIQKGKSSAESRGQKTSKPQEKVEKKPEQKSGDQRSLQSFQLEMQSEAAEGAVRDEHVGVPCLDIQVSDPKAMIGEILRDGKLPTEDEVTPFEYPEERLGSAERVEPFTIVAPEGAAMEDDLAKAPDTKGSSAKGHPKAAKATSRDSSAEKQISTWRTESPRDSTATRSKSTVGSASVPTEFLRDSSGKCASAQQLLGFVLFYNPTEETQVPGLGALLLVLLIKDLVLQ
ncbi:hydrocephalus-inducing protein homolog [Serinus canaria]|uniref:hydrocephalus-inducing protein homolog n=1 Tax=Serinus canaria TaxID=9135 RepID=UPI0021CCB814|nr:hydrocephalus-inducing protein homolog [Serinus canaria]